MAMRDDDMVAVDGDVDDTRHVGHGRNLHDVTFRG